MDQSGNVVTLDTHTLEVVLIILLFTLINERHDIDAAAHIEQATIDNDLRLIRQTRIQRRDRFLRIIALHEVKLLDGCMRNNINRYTRRITEMIKFCIGAHIRNIRRRPFILRNDLTNESAHILQAVGMNNRLQPIIHSSPITIDLGRRTNNGHERISTNSDTDIGTKIIAGIIRYNTIDSRILDLGIFRIFLRRSKRSIGRLILIVLEYNGAGLRKNKHTMSTGGIESFLINVCHIVLDKLKYRLIRKRLTSLVDEVVIQKSNLTQEPRCREGTTRVLTVLDNGICLSSKLGSLTIRCREVYILTTRCKRLRLEG